MSKTFLFAAAVLGAAALAGCGQSGSAERGGEDMDSAIENATQGQTNSGDGMMERAGESVDQMTGHENRDAADALHDATDNNPSTQP
ncbi:MAG: hypothetical protein AB7L65_07325 [Hyphomonadaceae bacterium]